METKTMALITLPLGPVSTTSQWYAQARLGVAILVIITWTIDSAPEAFFYISRCKEKSAPYSMYIAKDFLYKRADLSNILQLCWWSDGGHHFRIVFFC